MGSPRRKAGLLEPQVEGYRAWLTELGYTPLTVRNMLKDLSQVGLWARAAGLQAAELDEESMVGFVAACHAAGRRRVVGPRVACQPDGTGGLPRPRDHLGRLVMVICPPRLVKVVGWMSVIRCGRNGVGRRGSGSSRTGGVCRGRGGGRGWVGSRRSVGSEPAGSAGGRGRGPAGGVGV